MKVICHNSGTNWHDAAKVKFSRSAKINGYKFKVFRENHMGLGCTQEEYRMFRAKQKKNGIGGIFFEMQKYWWNISSSHCSLSNRTCE